MKLLITGAASPRGQATIAAAVRAGHQVRAIIAPSDTQVQPSTLARDRLTWITLDWLEDDGHEAFLAGVDAVIHIDEVESGPFERHFLGTVQTTERLLQAMVRAGVRRLVLTSSLVVYGYDRLRPDQLLDETTALEPAPELRSAYVQAKLMQEALLCSFNHCWGGQATLLRPGLNYGPGHLWQPVLGLASEDSNQSNRYWQISPLGSLPLLYSEHFASAALAALSPLAIGETFNLVDDGLPSRAEYSEAIARLMPIPQAIPVPWKLARFAQRFQNRTGLSLPTLPQQLNATGLLNASFKPLRYSNTKAKRMLGWQPKTTWKQVLQEAGMAGRSPLAPSPVTIESR
jgi:2-alkyl-3-oxoalkanoate reductase